MRDATFQFPECTNSSSGPLPSPRPRPRRRFASESSIMESSVMGPSGPIEVSICNGSCCHLGQNERQSWANVGTNLRSIAGDFHACRTKVSRLIGSGRGKRIARTERARGKTLRPGDWPFPRQTAQLRCTIIYLASSRARASSKGLSIAAHHVSDEDGETEREKSRLPVIGPGLPNARNRNSSFTDNLLSLLIPTPLRETLWATMALYLGWRLVSRLR
ncbi:hypothetical protein X777_09513 [Ooceraea biroi]|uniref:Uncharacterized protein n=1 Tax=Ooceraea biroi TaxID=2015173 RepID=A0A026W7Y4_OOCBI|nr:hypothetical protein X777_09513 [Ooceraea biroi]